MADYTQDWNDYRRVRNHALLALLGFVPIRLIDLLIVKLFGQSMMVDFLIPILVLAWILSVLIAGSRLATWPCPRCGGRFSSRWWDKGLAFVAQSCANCGLKKFARD